MSIAAALPGTVARFKQEGERPDGSQYVSFRELPVVAWAQDDEGYVEGLMVTDTGKLTIAKSYRNFDGYGVSDDHTVQITPADGWVAIYKESEDGESREPLVAWALRADGSVVGLTSGDYVDSAETPDNFLRYEREAPSAGQGSR
jgi:hypothetical protein